MAATPVVTPASRHIQRLAALPPGVCGTVVGLAVGDDRADRLAALGVTAGARVSVLQTFPAVVFLCDQTELAVEPAVARAVLVEVSGG